MNNQNAKDDLQNNLDEKASENILQKTDQAPSASDSSLDDLVREQQSIARKRLKKDLGREPSQEEIDQWLNEHTEGY